MDQGRSRAGYEGLDPASVESAPATPRPYAGLGGTSGVQSPAPGSLVQPGSQFDQLGYLRVIADPDNADQTQQV